MKNKVYVKEGMGFEGITMMQKNNPKLPRVFRFIAVFLILVGLLGFAVAGIMQANKAPEQPKSNIVVLPTSSEDNDFFPTEPASSIAPVEEEVTPTVKATATPTVTKAPVASSLTVAVLNGSGVKGAAAQVSEDLETSGYEVSRTGNADAFTYEGITVQIKKSLQKQLDQLKKDLSAAGYLITESTTDLDENEDTDVVIIVGGEKS